MLKPASDAAARQASQGSSEASSTSTSGQGSTSATSGGFSSSSSTGGQSYSAAAGGSSAAGPKGQNVQQGGFDSGAPNASFDTDIGGKNDPGRVALGEFQRSAAESGPDAGSGPRQSGVSNDGQFDVLKEASA